MSIAEAESLELAADQPAGLWREAWGRLKRNPAAWAGMVLVLGFVLLAIFAPLIAPYGPAERVGALAAVPDGPSAEFIFGLDEQGRDLFSRVVYGSRLSLLVGVVSVAVGLALGVVLGAISGYVGGRLDGVIMRSMDLMLAFPAFLLAIGLVTIMGRGLWQIMVAIGIVQVPIFARLLRGSVLAQRKAEYVLAAESVGIRRHRILIGQILPNAMAPVIVQATLSMATAIIEVAGLSFVGLGPGDPGLPEWGLILANNAHRLHNATHLVIFPGFAIVISVLGINLLGDGLREALDPRLRERG
jgi:peptide/nickel transport system permease protein